MKSVLLYLVNVYHGNFIIGHGYFVESNERRACESFLVDFDNRNLPVGWYTIQIVEEKLAVVTERKQ